MAKKCDKCGYERQPSDMAADYECPRCGAIYAKVGAARRRPAADEGPPAAASTDARDQESHSFDFPDRGCLINLPSLSFLLPSRLDMRAAPVDLPAATAGQRIWAAISTFSHMLFLGWVMRGVALNMAILYLSLSDSSASRSFFEAWAGGGALVGMLVSLFLLPLLWRGHTFGQRAMGVIVVPPSDEEIDDLDGLAIMIRRLTFRTRSACAQPLPARPWNRALLPYAALVLVHVLVLLPTSALLRMGGSLGEGAARPTHPATQQDRRDAVEERMATSALRMRCAKGDENACEALEAIEHRGDRERMMGQDEVRRWQAWAQMVRNEARSLPAGLDETVVIQSWDGGFVEISRDNVEDVIEEQRPEGAADLPH